MYESRSFKKGESQELRTFGIRETRCVRVGNNGTAFEWTGFVNFWHDIKRSK
jgi:hypothetical protein